MQIIVYIIFAVIALFLIGMWPGRGRRERMEAFMRYPIAHRGFHDNKGPAPENSMAAYKLAVEKGYGIELDIRLTADGQLICMHDRNLRRATGTDQNADDMNWSELQSLRLFQSEERIPRFREVLRLVDGRVPIVMEIKAESMKAARETSIAAIELLDSYEGTLCMESFHPGVLRYFKMNRPAMLRGQLADRFHGHAFPKGIGAFCLSCCISNAFTRPDFIAYNIRQRKLLRFRILRDLFHAVCAGWTVRSEEDWRAAADSFDIFIFEGFEPQSDRLSRTERKTGTDKSGDAAGKMNKLVREYMLVSGMVQAVGFRYRAVHIAGALGVTGFVRNRDDDRVEMEVQGTPEELEEMLRLLKEQRFIEITGVERTRLETVPGEYEFKVRY